MDLVLNGERLTAHSDLDPQTEHAHRHSCKTAVQDTRESDPAATCPELLEQYTLLSARYAELAAAYLELEQTLAGVTVSREREQELQQQLEQSQAMLSGVLSSLSWRVTVPLRKLMAWLRGRK